jgi:hypothetical protein
MPRDSRAFLLARIRIPIRTRRSGGPMLSWVFRLSRAFPACRGTGFPAPSLLRFPRSVSKRRNARRFRALPADG